MERSLRPRSVSQYVSQQEWQMEVQEEDDFILARRYSVKEKFQNDSYKEDHGFAKEMNGADFNLKYVQKCGLTHSVVFRSKMSLGLRMPSAEFTVADVKKLVGARRKVDVIDTLTQDSITMSLGQWTKYYETFPRQRLLNIISLEISCTKLDHLVEAPAIVKELDWVEQAWPVDLKIQQSNPTNDLNKMMYPKVQKYCLMSVAGCYTDFHLDFGGTSVWYHVLKGEKVFLLIPPSAINHSLFQHWQMSGEQERVFLAELVEKAQIVHLHAGDTFIMPAGWIHAVYTPLDSLVFGGNFLHSFSIAQQLVVAEIEQSTKVPPRLKYPFYGTIHWHVLRQYALELKKLVTCKSKCADESENLVNGKCQWLKQVSVAQVIPSTDVESSASIVSPQEVLASIKSASPKPHFSNHERGGLLLLVQRMKNNLFEQDVPVCIDSPSELLCEIETLLNSKMSDKYATQEPNGIGILQQNHQTRAKKRARKYSFGDHKSKICKESHASVSSSEDLFDNYHVADDITDNPSNLFNSKTELNFDTPPTATTSDHTVSNSTSPVDEISVAVDTVSSSIASSFCKDNITSVVHNLNSVGELLSATSPTPLSTEATIIEVPNPVYK